MSESNVSHSNYARVNMRDALQVYRDKFLTTPNTLVKVSDVYYVLNRLEVIISNLANANDELKRDVQRLKQKNKIL
jgi:hypothetical protein